MKIVEEEQCGDRAGDAPAVATGAWFLYLIRTRSGKLYTGITTDVARRFAEHQCGRRGARFFRSDPPERVVYQARFADRSAASRAEYRVKALGRAQKLALVERRQTLETLIGFSPAQEPG